MVAVCLKCGNKGFHEALVYCGKCNDYAQHRYCLETPRVYFVEDVIWFCEDCEAEVEKPSTPRQLNPSPYGLDRFENLEKEVIDQVEKFQEKQMRGTDNKRQLQNKRDILRSAFKWDLNVCDPDISILTGETQCSSSVVEDLKMEVFEPIVIEGASSDEAESDKLSNVWSTQTLVNAHARPISHPTWRGNLAFSNKNVSIDIGVVAHLSCLACYRVHEEAKLFPEVLSVNMLRRSALWPKSFEKRGPSDESIALFFFPDSKSVEKPFDKFVDNVISLDMAMSVMLENAELLIFPSSILPIQHQRFQSKFYLWGVFRKRKAPRFMNTIVHIEEAGLLKSLVCESSSMISTLSNDHSISSSSLQTYGASSVF